MKNLKLLVSFLALFALPILVFAQNDYRVGDVYEGYILKKDNTKEHGYILFQDPIKSTERVIFYKDKNNRRSKKTYKPKDLNGYKVGSVEFKTIKYGMIMRVLMFGKIETKGHITVFDVCNSYDETKGEYTCEMVLQKGDDKPVSSSKFLFFAKNMSEYISDHKELAKKVKNKEKGYRLLSMLSIIEEYNKWYEENHKGK